MTIVTHNVTAMNTNRQLEINAENKKKSTEKLSSGYRINRSADDAAGLTISEKMRWEIRGLNKGSNNAEDGISLIQTAEGALNEVHDVLQRMNELATQAANDTNTETDRDAIQKELNQLKSEINRVSKTTTFNTRTVLLAKQLIQISADDFSSITMDDTFTGMGNRGNGIVYGKAIDFSNVNLTNKEQLINKQFFVSCSDNCNQVFSFKFTDQQSTTATISGRDLTVEIGIKDTSIKNGSDITNAIYNEVVANQGAFTSNAWNDVLIGHANGLGLSGSSLIFYATHTSPPYASGMGLIHATDMVVAEEELHLQISAKPYQEIELGIRTINSATLGIGSLDVSSYESAGESMDAIQNAIDSVSDYRSYLGAMQNRLTHTITNNDNTSENTQSSESLLRDTDMAEELVQNTKLNILEQVGQTLLTHSNQSPAGVLRLIST